MGATLRAAAIISAVTPDFDWMLTSAPFWINSRAISIGRVLPGRKIAPSPGET